jgi:hypothetical protein
MQRYFFVCVVLVDRDYANSTVFHADAYDAALRNRLSILQSTPKEALLYLSNVKEGTHAEREARGEIPAQLVPTSVSRTAPKPSGSLADLLCDGNEEGSVYADETRRVEPGENRDDDMREQLERMQADGLDADAERLNRMC